MLRYLSFFLLILFSTHLLSVENNKSFERKKRIVSIIDQELKEMIRLERQQRGRRPETIFRIAELYAEKARIIRENENDKYLAIPTSKRVKLNKKSFFRNSNKLFKTSIQYAQSIPQKFPRYKSLGELYFILAQNLKEVGLPRKANKYYLLAARKSSKKVIIDYSNLMIANDYFNRKKYKKAAVYFEKSLMRKNDKWWTKDTYNLAWSYYKLKQYEKSLDTFQKVYLASKSKKFVDMRNQVERDLAFVFVDAGKLEEGISFYKKNQLKFMNIFISVAKKMTQDGRFLQAEKILDHLLSLTKEKEERELLLIDKLNLFSKYANEWKHLRLSDTLVRSHKKAPFSEENLRLLYLQVTKKAALLQKAVSSGLYKNIPKKNKLKIKRAATYFKLASELGVDSVENNIFYMAETYFLGRFYEDSLKSYISSYDVAKANQNSKIISQSIEGMIASLGQKTLKRSVKEKYFIPVYTRYLQEDFSSPRAQKIYVRLYKAYLDVDNLSKLEDLLLSYASHFPKRVKTQESMLAQLLETYRKQKNFPQIQKLVSYVDQNKIQVTKSYHKILSELKTKLQIEAVQSQLISGNKRLAIDGYLKIYHSSQVNRKGKANASYNLAALYYELEEMENCFKWTMTSLDLMTEKEVVRFADSLLSISAGFFQWQDLKKSMIISQSIFKKTCEKKSPNKSIAFKNTIFMALANDDFKTALQTMKNAQRCQLTSEVEKVVNLEVLKYLETNKKWDSLKIFIFELEKNSRYYPYLISPLNSLIQAYTEVVQKDMANKMQDKQNYYLKMIHKMNLALPLEAVKIISEKTLKEVRIVASQIQNIKLQFPENTFNQTIKLNLSRLEKLSSLVAQVQELGAGEGVTEGYYLLIKSFNHLAQKISQFSPPKEKGQEYVKTFKNAMKSIYEPLFQSANDHQKDIQKIVLENDILSPYNFLFFSNHRVHDAPLFLDPFVIMDRVGVK